jgi:hypothetical protein
VRQTPAAALDGPRQPPATSTTTAVPGATFVTESGASDLVTVDTPQAGQLVSSPLHVRGRARGRWYFEGDFPVRLLDARGRELAVAPAVARGEWMTEDLVPFEVELRFGVPATTEGVLVLERNNASGLREHDDALRLPVRFAPVAPVDEPHGAG